MKKLGTLIVSAAVSALLAGAASAHAGHGAPSGPGRSGAPAMGMQGMGGGSYDMMQMMPMMMRMHGGMMGGQGMGMMGGGMPGMGALLPGLAADADGDGVVTAEELRDRLQGLVAEYDADGNRALSLDEFAALHAALIREIVVDRFQFLDDDGDGTVTEAEIAKPARLLEQMQAARQRMMEVGPGQTPNAMPGQNGMMPGQGGMMQGN